MKFGKTDKLNSQQSHLQELHFWPIESAVSSLKIYSGGTNWTSFANIPGFYLKKPKIIEQLGIYSRLFNAIELNTTYYRIPTKEQIKKWEVQTEEGFKFCPKLPQTISNNSQIDAQINYFNQFWTAIQAFEQKLGPCFMQMPEHFGASKLSQLLEFLDHVPKGVNLLLELRHESWFQDKLLLRKLASYLNNKALGFVITDTPGRQDVLHGEICCSYSMIRFVAADNKSDDTWRISIWKNRISEMAKHGVNEIYFFIHCNDPFQLKEWALEMMNYNSN